MPGVVVLSDLRKGGVLDMKLRVPPKRGVEKRQEVATVNKNLNRRASSASDSIIDRGDSSKCGYQ